MKFYEWVNWFEQKSGERFYLPPDFCLEFDEEKGFILWKSDGEYFILDQSATTDYKYWKNLCFEKAKQLGLKKGKTFTRRNALAFARLTGGTVKVQGYDEYGRPVSIIEWGEADE